MSKPVLVAAVLTAVLAFPAAALADNSDSFAGARNGQADLPLDEEVVDGNLGYGTEAGEVLECPTRWAAFPTMDRRRGTASPRTVPGGMRS